MSVCLGFFGTAAYVGIILPSSVSLSEKESLDANILQLVGLSEFPPVAVVQSQPEAPAPAEAITDEPPASSVPVPAQAQAQSEPVTSAAATEEQALVRAPVPVPPIAEFNGMPLSTLAAASFMAGETN